MVKPKPELPDAERETSARGKTERRRINAKTFGMRSLMSVIFSVENRAILYKTNTYREVREYMKEDPLKIATQEVDEKFRSFTDRASEFSKDISSIVPYGVDDPSMSAQMNLQITRVIFAKWALDILVMLYSLKAAGFEAMKKTLRGISPRVLSEKLKRLEKDGLIRREVQSTRPIRVLYELTETGLTAAKLGEPVFLYLRYKKGLYGHDHQSK